MEVGRTAQSCQVLVTTEEAAGAASASTLSTSCCLSPSFRVQPVDTPERLRQALEIRTRVFQQEQGIPVEVELDGRDEEAFHVLILKMAADGEQERAAATGRVLIVDNDNDNNNNNAVFNDDPNEKVFPGDTKKKGTHKKRSAVLGRIAVLAEYRGQGLGKCLVRTLEDWARHRHGATSASLTPHSYLQAFYARQGYRAVPNSTRIIENNNNNIGGGGGATNDVLSPTTTTLITMVKQLME